VLDLSLQSIERLSQQLIDFERANNQLRQVLLFFEILQNSCLKIRLEIRKFGCGAVDLFA
jgi:hypothetical protein